MNDRDIIRLGKAMEWTHVPAVGPCAFIRWKVKDGEDIGLMNNIQPFNPENDANDDYAVLEWMRSHKDRQMTERMKFTNAVQDIWDKEDRSWPLGYQIGDYARAALTVLKILQHNLY